MFDGTPMTKEEFLDGIREAAADMADPSGEFNSMIEDFRSGAEEIRRHDPVMADKLVGIVTAFENFGAYIKERSELLTAPTEGV